MWSTPAHEFSSDTARVGAIAGKVLGPYELHTSLGEGGMGIIYGAIHQGLQIPVAIKAITREGAAHPRFRQALQAEIRAVCALNHPAIVRVLDQGLWPDALDDATDGALHAGSPFLVMEYVPHGTLADVCGRVTWAQAKAILLTLLDALAHAHSVDVVHRDIKPSNILLSDFGDRVIPKIADFGLAFDTFDGVSLQRAVGTPHYMAPEQISKPWRKHGPWSDLYAVGCVAFELLTGKRAFSANSVRELAQMHLDGRRREFLSVVNPPEAFHAWLDRMMAIDATDRFRSAADAARALFEMDDATIRDVRPPDATNMPIAALTPTLDVFRSELDATSVVDRTLQDIPDHWRAPVLERMPMRAVGAGFGVLGLRTVPLVGRSAELDVLWSAFRSCDEARTLRVCMLEGGAGSGKSRLAAAFAQRVRELGVAQVFRATHHAEPQLSDGLAAMVARAFRTVGASANERDTLVFEAMAALGLGTPYDVQAASAMCEEADIGAAPSLEFSSTTQRFALLRAILRQAAARQPVVVWLDNIHFSFTSVAFLDSLLKDKSLERVFVLAAWDPERADDPITKAVGDILPRAQRIDVLPLTPREHRELIDRMAPLAPADALRVSERTGGNPAFLVEVLAALAERDAFELTEAGFVVKPGELERASVQSAVAHRVEDFVAGNDRVRAALELAAAIGVEVSQPEWEASCRLGEPVGCEELLARLVAARIAVVTETGWKFAHPRLREALEQNARAGGRWEDLKRRSAEILKVQNLDRVEVRERLGRCLLACGEVAQAREHLWIAADARRRTGAYTQSQQNILWYLEACEPGSPEWARGFAIKARTHINSGDPRSAQGAAERALSVADLPPEISVDASLWLAMARQMMQDPEATGDIERAYDVATRAEGLEGYTLTSLAFLLTNIRRFDQAREMLEKARSRAISAHDQAFVEHMATRTETFAGNWQAVRRHGEVALERLVALGHLPAAATVLEYLAEAERKSGELVRAAELLRKCLEMQASVGGATLIARVNLGSVALSLDEYSTAERQYVQALQEARAAGRRAVAVVALSGLLCTAVALQRWTQVQDLSGALDTEIRGAPVPEPDVADHLVRAVDLLLDSEFASEATRLLELAILTNQAMKRQDLVDALQQRLDSLDVFPWDVHLSSVANEDLETH